MSRNTSSRDAEERRNWDWPDPDTHSDDWPPELIDPIDAYCNHLYTIASDDDPEKMKKTSVDNYKQDFNWYHEFLRINDLSFWDIGRRDALKIGTWLGNNYSGSVAGTRYRNIKKTYQFHLKAGTIDDNPFAPWETKGDLGISENTSVQSTMLEDDERYGPTVDEIRLMEENAGTDHRLRNQLIIRLLFNTGCRANELCQISMENIDWDEREIFLPSEICKFNKARTVAFQKDCELLMREWVEGGYRDKEAYGGWSEYLFPTSQKPFMSTDTVEDAVTGSAERAGLNRGLWTDANDGSRNKVTPHNLRYSTGYYMLFDENDEPRPDANIYKVSQYLGHSSVQVTERIYIEDNPRAGVDAGHELMPD